MSYTTEPIQPSPSPSRASGWRSRRGLSLIALFIAGSLAVGFIAASLIGAARDIPTAQGASPSPSAAASESPSASPPSPSPSDPVPTATPEPTPAPITSTTAEFSLLPADPPVDFASTITCDGDIGPSDPVAVVSLKTGDEGVTTTVLRDYADLDAPRTVCTFGDGNCYGVGLIDARHALINSGGVQAIVDLPEVRYHWFALPQVEGEYATVLTVSPQSRRRPMDQAAPGAAEPPAHDHDQRRRRRRGRAARGIQGGRCGSPRGLDSNPADYQHLGRHYYALDQLYAAINALIIASGADSELEVSPPVEGERDPATIPTFPVWSPIADELFFRMGDDVMRWTSETGPELFLADTPWFHPTITADGRYLAYTVDSDLYLIDFTTDATPQLIREDVKQPVFVNDSQLWFMDATGPGCATDDIPAERIYDVRDGSESPSVIKYVRGRVAADELEPLTAPRGEPSAGSRSHMWTVSMNRTRPWRSSSAASGSRAAAEEADAAQELAIGHSGGTEDDVAGPTRDRW